MGRVSRKVARWLTGKYAPATARAQVGRIVPTGPIGTADVAEREKRTIRHGMGCGGRC
jgi:hypothetical protein